MSIRVIILKFLDNASTYRTNAWDKTCRKIHKQQLLSETFFPNAYSFWTAAFEIAQKIFWQLSNLFRNAHISITFGDISKILR